MAIARKSFESILLDRSWVSEQDLERARQRKKPGQDLADVLVDMGALEPQRLARAIAQEYWLPFQAHVDEHAIDPALLGKVPINYAKKNRVLPLSGDGQSVTVAIADPSNYEPLDDLRMLFGMPVHPVVVPPEILNDAINRSYDQATTTTAQDLMIDLEEERLDVVANELAQEPLDLLDSDDAAPIIKLVNGLLSPAGKEPARDHLAGQGHVGPQYRREAAAAGRPNSAACGRPRHRHPRLHHPDRFRRTYRAAPARSRAGAG